MSDLVRKQVYITRAQENLLKKKAAQLGVSEAELVREALDRQVYKVSYPRHSAEKWQKELQFIQGRIAGDDSRSQRTWKRDDLYGR